MGLDGRPDERYPLSWTSAGIGFSTPIRGTIAGVPLPYHLKPIMGDVGKPIRETERPAPVRAPEPEPDPDRKPPPPEREPPPPEREPEPVEAQRA